MESRTRWGLSERAGDPGRGSARAARALGWGLVSVETMAHNGLRGPVSGSPARVPGSVRRTTSLDLTRPDGPHGPARFHGRARDVVTEGDGGVRVVDAALVTLTVDAEKVTSLVAHPQPPGLDRLVGRRPLIGWRTGLWRYLRAELDAGTALHQILDEVPGGVVISGFTGRRVDQVDGGSAPRPPRPVGQAEPRRRLDVCAGWAAAGRAARIFAETGVSPPPVTPLAPPLTAADDPHGWHTLPPLPIGGMSRRRRIDVARRDGGVVVAAMWRDVFVDPDGRERVLHEYDVDVLLDEDTWRVEAVRTDPHVLPHTECPLAAASAQRIVGLPVADLRDRVSADIFGPSSCTHLNDLLRGVTDAPALARHLVTP